MPGFQYIEAASRVVGLDQVLPICGTSIPEADAIPGVSKPEPRIAATPAVQAAARRSMPRLCHGPDETFQPRTARKDSIMVGMKSKLDGPYLAILAALGLGHLGTACVGRVAGDDDVASGSESDSESTGSESSADTGSESATDSGDTGATTETTETGGDPYVCEDPQPIMQAGTDLPSGFVICADGFVHRIEQVECVMPQGADNPDCIDFACSSAADCVAQPYGSCTITNAFEGCGCHYGCATDADCDDGYICACAGVTGDEATCIPADCTTTGDCGEGLCGLSDYAGCCSTNYATACAAPGEPCHVDSECSVAPCYPEDPLGETAMHQCTAQNEGGGTESWTCQPPGWCGCDCGRPFFVEGSARVAEVIARHDWQARIDPGDVDPDTSRRLAAYWTEIGQLEHASIASFARFCLQLIQLGAPADLLVDSQQAMADEVRHARAAFGLASAYAGAPVGPGALDVAGSLAGGSDLRGIVEGLVIEACVGETLAAIEVREAARHARDPVVAAMLEAIADDELRHARLGWRSLRWILDDADASLREVAWASFDVALRGLASAPASAGLPASLRAHGVLDDELREQVRRAGVESLIRPCLVALRQHFGAAHSGYDGVESASVSTS
jgi:hypothetical protein